MDRAAPELMVSKKTKLLLGVSAAALMLAANPSINMSGSGQSWIEFGPNAAYAQGATCGTFAAGAIAQPAQGIAPTASSTACGAGTNEDARALALNSIAVGSAALVPANAVGGIAIGADTNNGGVSATASGLGSIAIGSDNSTPAQGALATGFGSVALGESSRSLADRSVAIGSQANASAANATAVGAGVQATGANSTALGNDATASGTGSLAIGVGGTGADSTGLFSIAIGGNTLANNTESIAFGANIDTTGAFSTAVGNNSNVSGFSSQAFGTGNNVTGNNATAIGVNNTAAGTNSVAIGVGANTKAGTSNGIAIGTGASSQGTNATAIGTGAVAQGSVAIGAGAKSKLGNTAVGDGAQAFVGAGASAYGQNSVAAGANSTAVGLNTQANAAGSVAIGTNSKGVGAVSNLTNEFVLGTRQHTYTTRGITSDLSRNRQTGPLEVVTSDANGHLATDNGDIFNQINNLGNDVNKARAGIALAIAMEGPDLTGNERFGVSASWGNFDGENAFGMGFIGVLGEGSRGGRWAVTGGFGVGFVDDDNNGFNNGFNNGNDDDNVWGGRIGGQWTWGHKPVAYIPPEPTSLK